MKFFLVGGTVRDRFLGRTPRDTDYVVLDSSEEELAGRGLVKVGQSFPIFLDTKTGDEYTLARSLEEDLHRRDLTINALALDDQGNVIDLHGGQNDLRDKILRHVERENFFTDPLRVLRVARFQAQFPDFRIHPETILLMKEVSETSAYKNLLPERIIKELKRVFECEKPSLFFKTLKEVGGPHPHFPDGDLTSLDLAPRKEDLQFAAYVTNISLSDLEQLKEKLTIQNDWYELARAWIMFQKGPERAEELIEFYYEIDAFRKPWLIEKIQELGGKAIESFSIVKEIGIRDIDANLSGKEIALAIRKKRLQILSGRN